MDTENTKAAWESRAVMLPLMGLVAFILERWFGLELPVEVQGFAVDLVPTAIGGLMALGIWFRMKARAVIDRWF